MSFEQDVQTRANEKVAGLMDTLGDLIGNNGSLSTPLTALGGAALGGMAGKGLGMGGLGIGLGAALGGALGGVGANAINSQNMYQNMNDAAMINGISAGLNANDQTDMMQNQAIAQTNDTVNQLVGIVGDMMQGGMAMGGGMMPPADPSMGAGMDPSMMSGQPPMDQGAMMPPPPSAPMSGQVDNNGLGMKQGSYRGENGTGFEQDIINRVNQKLAGLVKRAEDEGGEMQGVTKAWTQDIPETTWFENLANSAPVSALLDAAEATGVDRWADSVNNFAGDIGTSLGNLVNSYDTDLADAADRESLMDSRLDAARLKNDQSRQRGYEGLKNTASNFMDSLGDQIGNGAELLGRIVGGADGLLDNQREARGARQRGYEGLKNRVMDYANTLTNGMSTARGLGDLAEGGLDIANSLNGIGNTLRNTYESMGRGANNMAARERARIADIRDSLAHPPTEGDKAVQYAQDILSGMTSNARDDIRKGVDAFNRADAAAGEWLRGKRDEFYDNAARDYRNIKRDVGNAVDSFNSYDAQLGAKLRSGRDLMIDQLADMNDEVGPGAVGTWLGNLSTKLPSWLGGISDASDYTPTPRRPVSPSTGRIPSNKNYAYGG